MNGGAGATPASADLRVQFIHGLESSPGSSKSVYLAGHFTSRTPAMDTSDFAGSVRVQTDCIAAFSPEVLVGSSFGGAVALALLQRGAFRGPTVLLAPAHRHFRVEEHIPAGVHVIVVHGTHDDVVSIEGSRALARTGSVGHVELVEVNDGHRLASLLEDDSLAAIVRRVAARARR
jgi:predicted esterase